MKAAQLATLRAAYLAEIERLMLTSEARFRSGELHATRFDESEAYGDGRRKWPECSQGKVEALCAEAFGLTVTKDEDGSWEGDEAAGFVVLSISPHADAVFRGDCHPCAEAVESAAWDLIALARSRGLYVPTPDETEDPMIDSYCPDCGDLRSAHLDDDGAPCACQAGLHGCGCTTRFTPHVPGPARAA